MTVDKDRYIKIPIWLVSVFLPILIALIISFGAYKVSSATFETKIKRNEQEIEKRVTRDEFDLVLKGIERIENKLDKHITVNNDTSSPKIK